ncbi:hypothetical protein ACFQY4_03175 [Catellatospora bangladeshensis]|nr:MULTISPECIES: hypothetical protein [Catellatospora]
MADTDLKVSWSTFCESLPWVLDSGLCFGYTASLRCPSTFPLPGLPDCL